MINLENRYRQKFCTMKICTFTIIDITGLCSMQQRVGLLATIIISETLTNKCMHKNKEIFI